MQDDTIAARPIIRDRARRSGIPSAPTECANVQGRVSAMRDRAGRCPPRVIMMNARIPAIQGFAAFFSPWTPTLCPIRNSDDCPDEDTIVQDDNPAESTTQEIKAAARDMLRMGSRWAHSALDWIDERRHEMNHHTRDERDYGSERPRGLYTPSSTSGQGDWQERERLMQRQYGGRREQLHDRSDREIQGDYSGGGYDQVGGRGDWSRGSDYGQRALYGREASRGQSHMLSPDDDSLRGDYGSSYGSSGASGYGGAGYGYGASAPGGVGYGAPGYGAGSSYAESRYHGDFQSRGLGEDEGYGSYGREFGSRDTSDFGRDAGRSQGGRGQEGYGQSWRGQRTHGSAGQGYGTRGFDSQGYGSDLGYGRSGQQYGERGYQGYGHYGEPGNQRELLQGYGQGSQGTQSGQPGRSYRGIGPRNYTRSDERIREDLNERLTDAHDIDASMITVEVNNGVATLTGTVNERWMKHRAEDIADGCTGVSDVRNNIQVQSQSGSTEFGRQSQGSQYGSGQQGASGQYGGSSQQGRSGQGSSASGAQGSSLGTGASASQGGSTGSQGSATSRGASQGSTGPNV